jgi:NADPH-dependent 7-cyano-7-deazaguanine reductase QueF
MQALPNEYQVAEIKIATRFKTTCSITNVPFEGTVKIMFRPNDKVVEFCSVEAWIDKLKDQSLTHEALTRLIYDTLHQVIEPQALVVETWARSPVHPRTYCRVGDDRA